MALNCAVMVFNPVTIIFTLALLLLGILRVEYRNLSTENSKKFQSKAFWSTEKGIDGKSTGFVVGKWFVGVMAEGSGKMSRPSMRVLVLRSTHANLCGTAEKKPREDKTPTQYQSYGKGGNYYRLNYTSIYVDITEKIPKPFQKRIIEKVYETYKRKNTATCLISGPPGCGKSSICEFLIAHFAKVDKVKCNYTDDFRPTEASDLFQGLYSDVDPEESTPFIVLIDEVDGILRVIGGEGIKPHSKFLIMVKTKTEWNAFLDKIEKGRWKNTIFIFTTNYTLAQVDALDTSYTRPGRIDHRFEIHADGFVKEDVPSADGQNWV